MAATMHVTITKGVRFPGYAFLPSVTIPPTAGIFALFSSNYHNKSQRRYSTTGRTEEEITGFEEGDEDTEVLVRGFGSVYIEQLEEDEEEEVEEEEDDDINVPNLFFKVYFNFFYSNSSNLRPVKWYYVIKLWISSTLLYYFFQDYDDIHVIIYH